MRLEPKIIAEGWVDLQKLDIESNEWKIAAWPEDILQTAILHDGIYAFEIIKEINKINKSQETVAIFAAGPIEDFLKFQGEKMINEILKEAEKNADFNHALGGVWKSSIPEDVWKKIEEARNKVW